MFPIAGYSYQNNESAIVTAKIYRSEQTNTRRIRSSDNILRVDNVIFPAPNNFLNVLAELNKIRASHQLHLGFYEPLKIRATLAR